MGEIKSAWEIAMEKVEELEELPPEELKRQEEERYTLIGQALADKYLGGLAIWQLEVEMDKYKDEDRELLSRIVILKLVSALELNNYERLEKVISYLKQMKIPIESANEMKLLFQEYEQVEQKAREEMVVSDNDVLHQLGISGNAIAEVNSAAAGESQQVMSGLAQPYKERLELLKQKLVQSPLK